VQAGERGPGAHELRVVRAVGPAWEASAGGWRAAERADVRRRRVGDGALGGSAGVGGAGAGAALGGPRRGACGLGWCVSTRLQERGHTR
jgi:hypothetical protein